jgi:CRP-like cAMP-binding protein
LGVQSENLLLCALGPAFEHLRPHLTSQPFSSGQVIKSDGGEIDRVWFPTRGLISSRVVLRSGHEIECALVGRTNALGLVGALGLPNGWARFVCLTSGHAWTMPVAQLASAARSMPMIERQLQRFSFAQIGYAAHLGVCNAMHSAEQRLARWLTTAAELLGSGELTVNQEDLGHILGLQRSAVNPALQKLRRDLLIEVGRGRIRILAPEQLIQRGCECIPGLRRALHSRDAHEGETGVASHGSAFPV